MIPLNEQGTIVLFSKLAQELGYTFVSIETGCPDAILKHGGTNVRVEFEYKATNFRAHKHDPTAVDLIICWEDDWPTAPIPVLSLANYVTLVKPEVARVPWWMRLFNWLRDVRLSFHDAMLEASVKSSATCPICRTTMTTRCDYEAHGTDEAVAGLVTWRCPRCQYVKTRVVSYDRW